ncbi:uncharacterized protein TNCV_4557001 [Trichonephila clavipes]|nr:uncharacterized protein TNCV_4557001 [Trichonephila clavipes]
MTSWNHMCCHSCNGSQEPFFNKTMLGFTRKGCHKTVFALLLPFLGLLDPQICLQSSISEIIWDCDWASHKEQQIWNEMSQDIIQKYASMPDRLASFILAREGSTGY